MSNSKNSKITKVVVPKILVHTFFVSILTQMIFAIQEINFGGDLKSAKDHLKLGMHRLVDLRQLILPNNEDKD